MTYLVMETHLSYAVVMDEHGRLLKVANLNYQVGQTVENVFEMQIPEPVVQPRFKFVKTLAAMSAIVVIALGLYLLPQRTPFATVTLSINPRVEIQVGKNERITKIKALNEDGKTLIDQYDYSNKDVDKVTQELIHKAHSLGFFINTDAMSLHYNSKDKAWSETHSQNAQTTFAIEISDEYQITITIVDDSIQKVNVVVPTPEIIEPIVPIPKPDPTPTPKPSQPQDDDDDQDDNDDDDDDQDDDDDDQDDDDDDDDNYLKS